MGVFRLGKNKEQDISNMFSKTCERILNRECNFALSIYLLVFVFYRPGHRESPQGKDLGGSKAIWTVLLEILPL